MNSEIRLERAASDAPAEAPLRIIADEELFQAWGGANSWRHDYPGTSG
jgi:hypothetical protein